MAILLQMQPGQVQFLGACNLRWRQAARWQVREVRVASPLPADMQINSLPSRRAQ